MLTTRNVAAVHKLTFFNLKEFKTTDKEDKAIAVAAKTHIAKHVGVNRKTVHRWITGIEKKGDLELFIDAYLVAKKEERKKRKVDGLLKNLVYKIREENKDCCGQKIKYYLKEDYGISLGTTSIYEILGEKYTLRSKWKKNQKRGSVPEAEKPRQVVQMDTNQRKFQC